MASCLCISRYSYSSKTDAGEDGSKVFIDICNLSAESLVAWPVSSASWSPVFVQAGSASVSRLPPQHDAASLCVRPEERWELPGHRAPELTYPAAPRSTLPRTHMMWYLRDWTRRMTGMHRHTQTHAERTLTSLLVQLVENVQQLRVHVVDGLEEWEHGTVIGDAASTHVVALHAVKEGGDSILQSLQKLLVVLLGLPVLVLLLKVEMSAKQSTESFGVWPLQFS